MATAEELLASAEACDDILTVDLDTQTIIIPKNVTILGVESDDSVRYLHFRIPRHFCKIDLSEFNPRINYRNAKSEEDYYEPKDVAITEDMIYFDWCVGRYAVAYAGNVEFNVCMRMLDENKIVIREFNTTPATLPVRRGLEASKAIIESNPDAIEQLKSDFMQKSIYDPQDKSDDVFEYTDGLVEEAAQYMLGVLNSEDEPTT